MCASCRREMHNQGVIEENGLFTKEHEANRKEHGIVKHPRTINNRKELLSLALRDQKRSCFQNQVRALYLLKRGTRYRHRQRDSAIATHNLPRGRQGISTLISSSLCPLIICQQLLLTKPNPNSEGTPADMFCTGHHQGHQAVQRKVNDLKGQWENK